MISYKLYRRGMWDISAADTAELFTAAAWQSGEYPQRLTAAIKGAERAAAAFDGSRLIALATAISDGAMNVYIPYVLVREEYRGAGVGRTIFTVLLSEYRDFYRRSLICYSDKEGFYNKMGLTRCEGCIAMERLATEGLR